MNCPKCSKINNDLARFCYSCGTALSTGKYVKCENGHSYTVESTHCPYCPPKTIIDRISPGVVGNSMSNSNEKTIIDNSPPQLNPNSQSSDSTVLVSPEVKLKQGNPFIHNSPVTPQGRRKLVGWLVTFDLNPLGDDFKLYSGRNTIGRSIGCDIVIKSPSISEKHSVILFRENDNKIFIDDLLSSNGTFLNGVIVDEKAPIKNDDEIKLGDVTLKVKLI